MRVKILVLALSLTLYGCQKKKSIQKVWISVGITEHRNPKEYEETLKDIAVDNEKYSEGFKEHLDSLHNWIIDDVLIFQFFEDTLKTYYFNETSQYVYQAMEFEYNYNNDSIIINIDDSIEHRYLVEELSENKLVVSSWKTEGRILYKTNYVFVPLSISYTNKNEADLIEMLVKDTFLLNSNKQRIFFSPPGEHIRGKIEILDSIELVDIQSEDYWDVVKIENELYLVIGSQVFHVTEIGDAEISGYNYKGIPAKVLFVRESK